MVATADEDETKRITLVRNERTKLTATWLNGLAIAAVAVGGIAPSVAVVVGSAPGLAALTIGVLWLLVGVGLHIAAHAILGRLLP